MSPQHPIGTGPFRFVSMSRMKKSCWSAIPIISVVRRKIETLRIRIVPDATVRALELRKGSADVDHQLADAGHGR